MLKLATVVQYATSSSLRVTCDVNLTVTGGTWFHLWIPSDGVWVGPTIPPIQSTFTFRLHNAIDSLLLYEVLHAYVTNRGAYF